MGEIALVLHVWRRRKEETCCSFWVMYCSCIRSSWPAASHPATPQSCTESSHTAVGTQELESAQSGGAEQRGSQSKAFGGSKALQLKQSCLLPFFSFFPQVSLFPVKFDFLARRKLFVILEYLENKICFIRCSYDPQKTICWSWENLEIFLRFLLCQRFVEDGQMAWRVSDKDKWMDQQRGRLTNVFTKHIFVLNVACNNCAFCLQVLLVYKIEKKIIE